jgi:hypothetical protein
MVTVQAMAVDVVAAATRVKGELPWSRDTKKALGSLGG